MTIHAETRSCHIFRMAIYAGKRSCHIREQIRGQVSVFFGPAEDFPYWKSVVLAGVKQRTHQAELVGKRQQRNKSDSFGHQPKLLEFD